MRSFIPYVPNKDTCKKLKDRNSRLKRENKDLKIDLKHKTQEAFILAREIKSLVQENIDLKRKLNVV